MHPALNRDVALVLGGVCSWAKSTQLAAAIAYYVFFISAGLPLTLKGPRAEVRP